MREPLGGGPQVLMSFKSGHDVLTKTQATPDVSGGTDLYYDKVRCSSRTGASDIFEVVVPSTARQRNLIPGQARSLRA